VQPRIDAIPGYLVPGQEQFLFLKVQSLPDDATIVEIGSYRGRSTVAMGYACLGTRRQLYCIDPWDMEDWKDKPSDALEVSYDIWYKNVRRNGLEKHVLALPGRSHEVLARWDKLANGRLIDFVFIDGSHEHADVLRDFEMTFGLVKSGGWIALHDVVETWPGSLRVWQEDAAPRLVDHEFNSTIACGRKP